MENLISRLFELKGAQSTSAFGRSIGLNQQTMDRYLKGREPPIGVIRDLCIKYAVSADWLLGLSGEQSTAAVTEAQRHGSLGDRTQDLKKAIMAVLKEF